jgi:hypothetical protein
MARTLSLRLTRPIDDVHAGAMADVGVMSTPQAN